MQDRHREPLRALAATAAILAVTLSLALSAGLAYAAEDEEEDVPLDTKLFRQFMKDIGAQRDGPPIEYRERAPLVVPPSRNLPPPQDVTGSVAANPAWPKDPDSVPARRKQTAAAAERARLKGSADSAADDARPLGRTELDRGRVATSNSGPASPEADDAQRPMRPDQLGNKRTFFDNVFNDFQAPGKPESAQFTSEPPRNQHDGAASRLSDPVSGPALRRRPKGQPQGLDRGGPRRSG